MNIVSLFTLIRKAQNVVYEYRHAGGIQVPEVEEAIIQLGELLDFLENEAEKEYKIKG